MAMRNTSPAVDGCVMRLRNEGIDATSLSFPVWCGRWNAVLRFGEAGGKGELSE